MPKPVSTVFRIVYGTYAGLEKKAVDIVSETLSDFTPVPAAAVAGRDLDDTARAADSLVVVGTRESNPLLRELAEQRFYEPGDDAEGYTLRIAPSPYNEEMQIVVIAGNDAAGALYGALDFKAFIVPAARQTHNHLHYRRQLFMGEALPETIRMSAPAVRHRGFWTWGHVIYDVRRYIDHMMRLKLNTLIVWNEFVPLNIREITDYAHECGIRLILGCTWGWNDWFDISDEAELRAREDAICKTFETEYAGLGVDGIYFQSFTETSDETLHGRVIGEAVTRFVNRVSARLWSRHPDLNLLFGLHATSVSRQLRYIRQVDPRITIVWEDCGAFPFSYVPSDLRRFEETEAFVREIEVLRGEEERFGAVTKGLLCLDWPSFRHQQGRFVMGCHSRPFIRRRAEEKRELWRYVEGYWLKNASHASHMLRAMADIRRDILITGLLEDALFEENIWFPAALFAEMLWDPRSPAEELLVRVAMRPDVEKA